jgi:hypothetical protein
MSLGDVQTAPGIYLVAFCRVSDGDGQTGSSWTVDDTFIAAAVNCPQMKRLSNSGSFNPGRAGERTANSDRWRQVVNSPRDRSGSTGIGAVADPRRSRVSLDGPGDIVAVLLDSHVRCIRTPS